MARRSDIDWDAIEREFRLGQKSNKQIAIEFAVQPSSVGRRAEKFAWVRDRSAEVRIRAENLLLLVDAGNANANANSNATPSTNDIKVAAQARADVLLRHRPLIARGMRLALSMLGDLEVTSSPEGQGLVETLLDALHAPTGGETSEDQGRRRRRQRDALDRALSLGDRVDTLKRLGETMDRFVQLDRQAFGISEKESSTDEHDSVRVMTDAERAHRVSVLLARAQSRMANNASPSLDTTAHFRNIESK